MKGVIFSAVQSAIERNFGDATWDQIIDDAELSGAYTSLGNYDDAELVAIITGAPDDTGEGLAERLRWFGKESVPFLVEGAEFEKIKNVDPADIEEYCSVMLERYDDGVPQRSRRHGRAFNNINGMIFRLAHNFDHL